MNKREMLHVLIDELLDVEETSSKGVFFSYGNSYGFDLHFCSTPEAFSDRITERVYVPFWKNGTQKEFDAALAEISRIKNTPDRSPLISIQLTPERAKELGLLNDSREAV